MRLLKTIALSLFLLIQSSDSTAQSTTPQEIKGKVVDVFNGEGLPYATLILLATQTGTSTNADGDFSFKIDASHVQDSISVSYIGYESSTIALADVTERDPILLRPAANLLDEIIVRPMDPEDYLKLVKKKMANNFSKTPFSNMAYYREEMKENGDYIMHSEGVFKTYYDAYQADAQRQHQLMLFRKSEDIKALQFMKEKAKKEQEKHLEQHPEDTLKYNNEDPEDLLMTNLGGPENILKIDVLSNAFAFLDSLDFSKFKYAYGPPSTYHGKEVITIDFKSKGKVDHARTKGRIFVDKESDAITAISMSGELSMPILIRPVLLVMGISIKNPHFEVNLQYAQKDALWYPQQIQWKAGADIIKRKTFKPNEFAQFEIEQLYVVNSRELHSPVKIPPTACFDPKLKMKNQVHNSLGLRWSEVNTIY